MLSNKIMADMWMKWAIDSLDKIDNAETRNERIWASNDLVTCARAFYIHAQKMQEQILTEELETKL